MLNVNVSPAISTKDRIKAIMNAKPKQKSKEELRLESQKKKEFQKAKSEFEQKFNNLMFELNLLNKFNDTYYLRIVNKTNYGFYAQLYLPDGLSFIDIEKHIGKLQQCLNCIWIMKTKQFTNYADLQIVTVPLDEEISYEAPKVKPWQMYLGLSFSLNPIIIDMNDYCMFLLAGATGSGKTRFIYQILLSWILNCTPQEVEIYIGDIAKNEYINFCHISHVKYYAYELEQLYEMVKILEKEFQRRKKLLSITREKGIATNIKEYNKISKNKLSYIVILNDEFSATLPDKTDTENEKEMKQVILDELKKLAKMGRNLGFFTFESLQKTVKDEIPSIIKSQSAVRISFRANDSISSEVLMGDHSAVGLAKRYAVYSLNGGEEKNYLFSPNLTTEMLNDMLEPYINSKHKIDKTKVTDRILYDSNKLEIDIKLKELPKGCEYIGLPEIKIIPLKLKGEDYIDY